MGCDYYISLSLRISFKKKTDEYHQPNIHLNLETRNGYFSYSGLGDEDEIGYEEKLKKYKEDCLTVKAKPILIYENGEFIKPSLKLKNPKVFKAERFPETGNALSSYKPFIEKELNKYEHLRDRWSDIETVEKVESRWERN